MLGDVPAGNGDPKLCLFGERVTPNQHKMVREFALLDNTYCSGICSADGHQWSMTAFGTDYLEKSFAGWPRSYPDGMGSRRGRRPGLRPERIHLGQRPPARGPIWDFGEFMMPACGWKDPGRKGDPEWKDYWDEFLRRPGLSGHRQPARDRDDRPVLA